MRVPKNKILLKKANKQTESGIVLTQEDERPIATVELVGEDIDGISVGDKIIYDKHKVDVVRMDNDVYIFGEQDCVLAFYE